MVATGRGTVLITGGNGLVGSHLTRILLAEGHAVRHLSRQPRPGSPVPVFKWSVADGYLDPGALEGVDHVVHLSGANIASRRWTPDRMRELYSSRVDAAELLLREAKRYGLRPRTFISAGGINYYGTATSDHIFTEDDPPANDTLGNLCQAWERSAFAWAPHARVAVLRMPMVLARGAGALPKMAGPARWGLAAPFGTSRQWMPWAHVEDVARAFVFLIQQDVDGAFNLAAPEQVRNRDFIRELAHVLHRPCFLPAIPAPLLRAAMGSMASLILEGSRVDGGKLARAGFPLMHPALRPALASLLQ